MITLEMCKSLVEKLIDPYIHIRYNAISAIINLFFCFAESDFEIEKIFFFNTNLIANIEFLLNENKLIHFEKNKHNFTQSEISKNEKLIKNIWELLILIADLYDESKDYQKINFDNIIKTCVGNLIDYSEMQKSEMQNLINNKNNNFNKNEVINLFEEIVIKSNIFLANLAGVKALKIGEANMLKEFMEFSFQFLSDFQSVKNANLPAASHSHVFGVFSFINSAVINTLFYLFCANSEIPMNLNLGDLILKLFENVDFDLGRKINSINEEIQNYVKHFDKEDKGAKTSDNGMVLEANMNENANSITTIVNNNTSGNNKSEESEKLSNMKKHLKILDANIKLNNLNLKTINDIITQFDGYNANSGNYSKSKEELIEMEELERKIYLVLNDKKFLTENFENLKVLLNENFLSNLCRLLNNLTIEEFLFNDFDKMLVIKEGLFELDYNVFSIINNLILDFSSFFSMLLISL
jgi:hypothetical protein